MDDAELKEIGGYSPVRQTPSGSLSRASATPSTSGLANAGGRMSSNSQTPSSPPNTGSWPWGAKVGSNGANGSPLSNRQSQRRETGEGVYEDTKAFSEVTQFWTDAERRATVDDINRCRVELDRARDQAQVRLHFIVTRLQAPCRPVESCRTSSYVMSTYALRCSAHRSVRFRTLVRKKRPRRRERKLSVTPSRKRRQCLLNRYAPILHSSVPLSPTYYLPQQPDSSALRYLSFRKSSQNTQLCAWVPSVHKMWASHRIAAVRQR